MIYTTKYSLAKPEENDTVDIATLNQNADKIDAELKNLSTEKASISEVANHSADTAKHITAAERTSWNGKADGMTYNNGQLQLKSGSNNVGLPVGLAMGGSVNAFVSGVNNFSYTATANGQTAFKIPITYVTTDIVELYIANLTLVRGTDFSVGTDGTVTLVSPLKLGDVVYGELQHTSYDANDLLHKEIFAAAIHTHTNTYVATLTTTWTGSSAPYTQTVSVAGILATDNPVIDLVLTSDVAASKLILKEWANVSRISTNNGSITVYCYENKPSVSIPIQLKAVR